MAFFCVCWINCYVYTCVLCTKKILKNLKKIVNIVLYIYNAVWCLFELFYFACIFNLPLKTVHFRIPANLHWFQSHSLGAKKILKILKKFMNIVLYIFIAVRGWFEFFYIAWNFYLTLKTVHFRIHANLHWFQTHSLGAKKILKIIKKILNIVLYI